jgi:Na+-transporting NADH:ubiquinone oxidoreductase subunit C
MSDRSRSIIFALVLCLVCGSLLTAASNGLKDIQQKNIMSDRKKNILKSVGLLQKGRQYSTAQIDHVYERNISKLLVDEKGNLLGESREGKPAGKQGLPVYLYINQKGLIEAYIIPIDTRGLWGKIFGYLAIKNDGSTIDGFSIYQHSETPGLGGEIEHSWFQNNFVGKKIIGPSGAFVSISIAKGKVADSVPKERYSNYVDGISGATLTGRFLTKGLKDILTNYEAVSVKFRNIREYCKTNQKTPWCRR